MGWIPTIKVENKEGRKIRINISEEIKYGLLGYHRIKVEESTDENLETSNDLDKENVENVENAENAEDEKVIIDDQVEVIPFKDTKVIDAKAKDAAIAAEIAVKDAAIAAEIAIE